MTGRFSFYRRRRVLPFAAVWCLVCINGATLAPLVVPPELLEGVAAVAASGLGGIAADAPQRMRYERGEGGEQTPAVVANVPPLVKNLRRPAPTRSVKTVVRGHEPHPVDTPGLSPRLLQRSLAAGPTDLARLCRLLL